MTPAPLDMSSGDARADRRFAYAQGLKADGDPAGALDLIAQALELVADWPAPYFVRGEILADLERREEAAAAFSRYLDLAPEDALGATARLAALGVVPPPDALPAPYVRALFDQYAPRFEDSLVDKLGYRAPALLRAALDRLGRLAAPLASALDLGCGTGLAGAAFRDAVTRLEGVDISPGMIAEARRKGLYDALSVGDLTTHLGARPDAYDLILAADVLTYLGALDAVMAAAREALRPGGLFACTTQARDGDGFVLGADCRYAHGESYVRACAERAGLRVVEMTRAPCRKEKGADVDFFIVVLERLY